MNAARTAAAYPLLLALGALDATGYSVIVPVAPAIADATGAGPATIGVLVASFPAGMVAGFAVAGWAVRRFGPRLLLIASLALVATGALGFVMGDSLGVYFAGRTLMGLGSGGIWIGVTFDTLERWPGQEYLCMSRVFAAYSIGGLIGPSLGAFGGIHGPFLAYLVLLLLAVPLVVFVEPAAQCHFTADRGVLRTRGFWIASGAILFASLGIGLGNTGSLGLLVDAVPVDRIVTAMVVWSQIGILGYLLGPLTGGIVAEGPGYGYVWLVPAAAALLVLALTRGQVTRA
jgi:MFS family permease